MQTPDKWQIQNQANTNKNSGIYTHTYTNINKIKTVLQKKKIEEIDPASKGKQKLYQQVKKKTS